MVLYHVEMATDGTRGFLLDSEHPMVIAAKEKLKKDYQREIQEQIEEKKRKKEAELRKRRHEEQLEELRVQREQEELALKFMREKENEIGRSNSKNFLCKYKTSLAPTRRTKKSMTKTTHSTQEKISTTQSLLTPQRLSSETVEK